MSGLYILALVAADAGRSTSAGSCPAFLTLCTESCPVRGKSCPRRFRVLPAVPLTLARLTPGLAA